MQYTYKSYPFFVIYSASKLFEESKQSKQINLRKIGEENTMDNFQKNISQVNTERRYASNKITTTLDIDNNM